MTDNPNRRTHARFSSHLGTPLRSNIKSSCVLYTNNSASHSIIYCIRHTTVRSAATNMHDCLKVGLRTRVRERCFARANICSPLPITVATATKSNPVSELSCCRSPFHQGT